jgi:glutathione S-transferase
LVDGDVKPAMGFVYGELLKAKRQIKEALGNNQARFKDVIAVVDKKMAERLDSPLHLTTYLLNPHYSYADASIFDAPKMTVAFISCVETFFIMMKTCKNKLPMLNSRSFRIEKGHLARSLQGLLRTLIIIQVKVVC